MTVVNNYSGAPQEIAAAAEKNGFVFAGPVARAVFALVPGHSPSLSHGGEVV